MKTEIQYPKAPKEMLPLPRGLKGELERVGAGTKGKKDGDQLCGQWPGEAARGATFRRGEGDGLALEVDEVHLQPGLAKAAPGVHGDEEGNAHPLGFVFESGKNALEFFLGYDALGFWFVFGQFHFYEGVGGTEFKSGSPAEDHGKDFRLKAGGVVGDRLARAFDVGRAPVGVVLAVPESDLIGMSEAGVYQIEGNPLPRFVVALTGAEIGGPAIEEVGHPRPGVGADVHAHGKLLGFFGVAKDQRLGGVALGVGSQAGGCAAATARGVGELEIPEGTAVGAEEGGHEKRKYSKYSTRRVEFCKTPSIKRNKNERN